MAGASGSTVYTYDELWCERAVTEVSDTSEAAVNAFRYRAFGGVVSASGGSAPPWRFVGKLGYYYQPQAAIGMHYVRARWYRHRIGRWMSQDPLLFLGSPHASAIARPSRLAIRRGTQYTYSASRPTVVTDPSGLDYAPLPVQPFPELPLPAPGCYWVLPPYGGKPYQVCEATGFPIEPPPDPWWEACMATCLSECNRDLTGSKPAIALAMCDSAKYCCCIQAPNLIVGPACCAVYLVGCMGGQAVSWLTAELFCPDYCTGVCQAARPPSWREPRGELLYLD